MYFNEFFYYKYVEQTRCRVFSRESLMPHTFYWERRRLAGRTVRIMKLLFENTIGRSDSSQMCPFGQLYAPAGETPALPVRRSAAKRQKVNGIGRPARFCCRCRNRRIFAGSF